MRRFSLFAIIGLSTAGVYFSTLGLFIEIFKIDYKVSVSLSYFLGVLFNFIMNKTITFKKSKLGSIYIQLFKYALLSLINYLITMTIVVFSVEFLGVPAYLGVALSMGATLIVGYSVSRYWIFKGSSND